MSRRGFRDPVFGKYDSMDPVWVVSVIAIVIVAGLAWLELGGRR